MAALQIVMIILIAAFLVWLLTYCLRMGVVGGGWGPWQKDAHRQTEPIRYWIGITALALGATFSLGSLIFLVSHLLKLATS